MPIKDKKVRDEQFRRVMEGCLTDLPQPEKNEVRIFLSSTFTDTAEERNALFREAVPRIRQFCRLQRLEFQIADMRWGVRDEAAVEHKTVELCLREVKKCVEVSLGPCFVALLGSKYGYRPFPRQIRNEEFNSLLSEATEPQSQLLLHWFKLDTNSEPLLYSLLPIGTDAGTGPDDWRRDSVAMETTLRQCARACVVKGTIGEADAAKYLVSVTEMEIRDGLLSQRQPNDRCMCILREFDAISMRDPIAGRFTDLIKSGSPNEESQLLLSSLKTRITSCMSPSSLLTSPKLQWTQRGIDPNSVMSHSRYLSWLCRQFTSIVIGQIELALANQRMASAGSPLLYNEALHHLLLCCLRLSSFRGRSHELQGIAAAVQQVMGEARAVVDGDKLQGRTDKRQTEEEKLREGMSRFTEETGISFANDDSEEADKERMNHLTSSPSLLGQYSLPLLLHGPSGCGKTSLSAAVASLADSLLPDCVKVVRFVGTSADSSSIRKLLASVCSQICCVYQLADMDVSNDAQLMTDADFLVKYFKALLHRVARCERPLLLLFDAVDQLDESDGGRSLSFVPIRTPPNVKLIVSFAEDAVDCVTAARRRFNEASFFRIDGVQRKEVGDILDSVLAAAGRKLAHRQRNRVLEAAVAAGEGAAAQPLLLRLLADRSCSWTSFSNDNDDKVELLPTTAEAAINQFFDDLEHQHGRVLVSRAFGLLGVSKSGLSEQELEDLLSLDDATLQDTYLHQLPPDPKMVRLPPLLWSRIKDDAGGYLVRRQAAGAAVIAWYHRQFAAAAALRYCSREAEQLELHCLLMEYFDGTWHNQHKPLKLHKRKQAEYSNCTRGAPDQPLRLSPLQLNLRKLDELPYHMAASGHFDRFVDTCASSCDWLVAQIEGLGLDRLLADLRLALGNEQLANRNRAFCQQLQDTLQQVYSLVCTRPNALPSLLIGQWAGTNAQMAPPLWQRVLERANEMVRGHLAPCLVPLSRCVQMGDGIMIAKRQVVCGFPGNQYNDSPFTSLSNGELCIVNCVRGGSTALQIMDTSLTVNQTPEFKLDVFKVKESNRSDARYVILSVTTDRDRGYGTPEVYDVVADLLGQQLLQGKNRDLQLRFSPSGKTLLSVHMMGQRLSLLSFPEWEMLMDYETEKSEILAAEFSNCGRFIGAISKDSTFTIWSVDSEQPHKVITQFKKNIIMPLSSVRSDHQFLKYGAHSFITCCFKGKSEKAFRDIAAVTVIDAKTGAVRSIQSDYINYELSLLRLQRDSNLLLCAATGSVIINGDTNKSILIFDLDTGECVSKVVSRETVTALDWLDATTGLLVYSCYENTSVTVSSCFNDKREIVAEAINLFKLNSHDSLIISLFVWKDYAFTVAKDNYCCVWDLGKLFDKCKETLRKKVQLQLEQQRQQQQQQQQEANGKPDAEAAAVEEDPSDYKTVGIHLCLEQKLIFCARSSGCLLTFNTKTQKLVSDRSHKFESPLVKLCGDDEYVAVAEEHRFACFRISDGEKSLEVKVKKTISCLSMANGLVFSAWAGMECGALVYRILEGSKVCELQGLYGFSAMAVTPAADYCISSMFDFPVIYSIPPGKERFNQRQMDSQMSGCVAIAVSRDSNLVAAGSTDGVARVLNMRTSKYLNRFQLKSSCVALNFYRSPAVQLVTAGFKYLLFWCLRTGKLLRRITKHEAFVTKLEFSDSFDKMISVGQDHKVVLWRTADWSIISSFSSPHSIDHISTNPSLTVLAIDCGRMAEYALLQLTERSGGGAEAEEELKAEEGEVARLGLSPEFAQIAGAFSSGQSSSACSIS